MATYTKTIVLRVILPLLVAVQFVGCGSSSPSPQAPVALDAGKINLIFVVSEDLEYQAAGDINRLTGNLTDQGLQRSLQMGTYLKQQGLGSKNVTATYALAPTSHLQTANQYPDMVGVETVQQFAMLNQITLSSAMQGWSPYMGNNYPINASYAPNGVPDGVAMPSPFCPACQGLDFSDRDGDNEKLVSGIVRAGTAGFYVLSAPWETIRPLLANINQLESYNLDVPSRYQGPNYVYAISIGPAGSATLTTYNSNLHPASTYPVLPPKLVATGCTAQKSFSISVKGGSGGAVVPAGANTNETVYIIRHAEAHPLDYWSDNNYVAAGQWRALDLPNALAGKINPQAVYSIDPSQFGQGTDSSSGQDSYFSTVAPALTAEPYAITNKLPYNLVTTFLMSDPNAAVETSQFFFTGGGLSNQKVLVAWAYQFIQPTINALLTTYHGDGSQAPAWPDGDYDTIWTVTLDARGNLTIDNHMCEGINSAALPPTPPQF
jgi:hypothetical protein